MKTVFKRRPIEIKEYRWRTEEQIYAGVNCVKRSSGFSKIKDVEVVDK